jgi:pyrroloquinoline quinone biosynthesis protein D
VTADSSVPRFSVGVRLREDPVRGRWVVLAPEKLFMPDEHAVEILKLVDGIRTLGEIVDSLASRYDAPRDVIAADVVAMLQDLAGKGAIQL